MTHKQAMTRPMHTPTRTRQSAKQTLALVGAELARLNRANAALVEALQDVLAAATGAVNGRNVTEATRREECAVIARAALALAEGGER